MLPRTARDYFDLVSHFRWAIPERFNIGVDVCDRWAAREPGRLALVYVEQDGTAREYTFAHIHEASNRLANLLTRDCGVVRGDRVAVFLPQSPETAITHVAVYKIGGIAVPLFALFGVEAIEYRLGN